MSVPVQVIDWKDSQVRNDLCVDGDVKPTLSLTHSLFTRPICWCHACECAYFKGAVIHPVALRERGPSASKMWDTRYLSLFIPFDTKQPNSVWRRPNPCGEGHVSGASHAPQGRGPSPPIFLADHTYAQNVRHRTTIFGIVGLTHMLVVQGGIALCANLGSNFEPSLQNHK